MANKNVTLSLDSSNEDRAFANPLADVSESSLSKVYFPSAAVNPVVTKLQECDMYLRTEPDGGHVFTHPNGSGREFVYYEPCSLFLDGRVVPVDSAVDVALTWSELLQHLGMDYRAAQNKPVIRMVAGEMHTITSIVEHLLSVRGDIFQFGAILAQFSIDDSGSPKIITLNDSALSILLSKLCVWERFIKGAWQICDVPVNVVRALMGRGSYTMLRTIDSIAYQPYFDVSGKLVLTNGYHADSRCYGVFNADDYQITDTSNEAAKHALSRINALLDEFPFVSQHDRSAALSAILTAAIRPSLPLAPGFHVTAPSVASGKSYLCDIISLFASADASIKVSYPVRNDEATKAILSALMERPPVIQFDDMTSNWVAHGVINRVFTSEFVTDRVLGSSKVATVSTRTMFLGSGNNVYPSKDLLRRVITIHLDAQLESTVDRCFKNNPVQKVRDNRASYVSDALTIILAFINNGAFRSHVPPIASYDDEWAEYCRHPLIWLEQPDPVAGLFEQLAHDPEKEALGELFRAWFEVYRIQPVKTRDMLNKVNEQRDEGKVSELFYALSEFPVTDSRGFSPGKVGKFFSKNKGRIVNGMKLQDVEDTSRKAWQLVMVSKPLPVVTDADISKAITGWHSEYHLQGAENFSLMTGELSKHFDIPVARIKQVLAVHALVRAFPDDTHNVLSGLPTLAVNDETLQAA